MKSTAVLAFDVGGVSTTMRPITKLEFEYNRAGERRPKMEHVGSWVGYNIIREILIHVDFDILGTDTSDYNAKKRLVQNSFSPLNPASILSVDYLGTLKLRFDGDTEDIQAPVTLDGDISMPYVGPAYTSGQMTLIAPDGYFTGVTTPANIYYPR